MNIIPNPSTSSRSRAPNFTREEQELLCDVLKPFMNIIESKKTDGVKHAEKQAVWSKVTEAFNANTKNSNRSADNLLLCYRNMKAKIKKQHSTAKMNLSDPRKKEELIKSIEANGSDWSAVSLELNEPVEVCESGYIVLQKELKRKESLYKKTLMGTGGGPPPPDDDEPLLKLKKIMEPQIDGLFTIYDGDSALMAQYQESIPDSEKTIPIEYEKPTNKINSNEKVITEEEETKKDPISSTPTSYSNRVDLLRKKKATPLICSNNEKPNKNKINEAFKILAEEKLQLVQLQKQALTNEMDHQSMIRDLKLEEEIKSNKHSDSVRDFELQIKAIELQLKEKELILLDQKINNFK